MPGKIFSIFNHQVCPSLNPQDALLNLRAANTSLGIQVRAHLETAASKFSHYIQSGPTNREAVALLVDELKTMSVFSHVQPFKFSGRSTLNDKDAFSLFSILNELGYRDISYHHKGTCFLIMRAVFRFTEVVLKIGWASNSPIESDPCLREAEFYLDIQGEYGKVYTPRYCPHNSSFNEFSSKAGDLLWG